MTNICLFIEVNLAMGYVGTGMGDHFSALLVSLMALRLRLVDRNPFRPGFNCPMMPDMFTCSTATIPKISTCTLFYMENTREKFKISINEYLTPKKIIKIKR